jgi:hypothetical protein
LPSQVVRTAAACAGELACAAVTRPELFMFVPANYKLATSFASVAISVFAYSFSTLRS